MADYSELPDNPPVHGYFHTPSTMCSGGDSSDPQAANGDELPKDDDISAQIRSS
jgi:hypothetical protein